MTYNDVLTSLYDAAKSSYFINGVCQGSRGLFSNVLRYPCFTIDSGVNTVPKEGYLSVGLSLYYVDRLFDETPTSEQDFSLDNEYLIQSRGIQVLESLFEHINLPIESRSYTPFTQQFQDRCAGVRCDLTCVIPFTYCLDNPSKVEVSLSGEHCTLSGAGKYFVGEQTVLRCVPDEGYQFVKWSDDNTSNPRNFTVSKDTSLSAVVSAI